MSSYHQILYHLVFCTKNRAKSIPLSASPELYKYIWGIIKNKNCILYRINGMEDHIHLLSDLHPSVALADYVKDIKVATSQWMKISGKFPQFDGWSAGYSALTYSYNEKEIIINYIKNQQEHHKRENFLDELKRIFQESAIDYDEKYLP